MFAVAPTGLTSTSKTTCVAFGFEEHNIFGGLGSAVAEIIAEFGKSCVFNRVGIPDCFSIVGYPEDLYCHYKLDTDGIIEKVREVMGKDFEQDDNWEDSF